MGQTKVNAGVEVVGGCVLCTLPFWSQLLDGLVLGAHAITAIGGAIITVHGLVRIWKGKTK